MAFKFLFIFVTLFIFTYSAFTQIKVPETAFIKLNSGQVFTGKKLNFNEKLLGASDIMLDSTVYKPNNINFFGYNASTIYGRVANELVPSFFKKNHLYFFKTYTTEWKKGEFNPATTDYTKILYWYSNGIDNIKKIRATSLLKDIKDDDEVIHMLKKAIHHRNLSSIFLGLTVLSGSICLISIQEGEKRPIVGPISLGVGVFSLIASYVNYRKKSKWNNKAIVQYTGIKF